MMKTKRIRLTSRLRITASSIIAAAAIILLIFLGYFELQSKNLSPVDSAEFHFIDVGQGDSSMILTSEACILIDCGPTSSAESVTEYIGRYTDHIDCLVFSHSHEDHMGATSAVLEKFRVNSILMTSYASDASFFSRALDLMEEKQIAVTEAAVGETYVVGDVALRVLSPERDFGDMNNNSIILRADVNGAAALYTGDAEAEAENAVINNHSEWLNCDILKIGHHGSSSSSSDNFIKAVSPSLAVISCGNGNSYGHPHLEVLQLLDREGIEYHRTDLEGSIIIEASQDGIRLKNP